MRFVKFLNKNKYIFLIITIGFILRIVSIDKVPPALNWDEVSHGYNAYSILKTGKDEWGTSFPIIFRSYGDYKLPVYIYLTVISEFFFGLNALSVRLVSLLAGVLSIFFVYLLAKELFKDKKLALISALCMAVEPWAFFLSRGAFEANLSITFVISGVYFLLKGIQGKLKPLLISSVLLGLSVWTYNSARIFVPLFLLSFLTIYWINIKHLFKKKLVTLPIALAAFFFIPMFFQLSQTQGQARYSNVQILDQGAIDFIENAQNQRSYAKLYINKYTYFAYHLIINWLSHFSPVFLFLEGGSQYQFNIPNTGLLYLPDILFFILGIFFLLKNLEEKSSKFILVWLLIAPVASSLTREAPHTLRASLMIPPVMMIIGIGLIKALAFWREKIISQKIYIKYLPYILYLLIVIPFFLSYLHNYYNDYTANFSWSWQYGYKGVVNYAKDHYNQYDQIIITKKYGEPHEFVLFYWPWDPQKYREDSNLERYFQSNWYWVDRFDKFYFVNDWDIPKDIDGKWVTERKEVINIDKKTLLITSPGTYPPGWNKLKTINFLDGKPAFDILEN